MVIKPVDLSFRSRRILYAAITEYIANGEPVSSRKLAKRYGLNLSAATIRTVLSDLEETGLLVQPHTSAGRVPTESGFRIFVDALVQVREVTGDHRREIVERLDNLNRDDLLNEATDLLSSLTGVASLITRPDAEHEHLAQLRFLPIGQEQVLALLITRNGVVHNRVLRIESVDPIRLEKLNNFIAEQLERETSLVELRSLLTKQNDAERARYDELSKYAQELLDATVGGNSESQVEIKGQGRLFDQPEFIDVDKVKNYLRAFEQKEKLIVLLDKTIAAGGVQVVIGSEAHLPGVEDVSVVAASYHTNSSTGTLGIIGPARMDYAKVVPLVGFTANLITRMLAGDETDAED